MFIIFIFIMIYLNKHVQNVMYFRYTLVFIHTALDYVQIYMYVISCTCTIYIKPISFQKIIIFSD
jgi:hypothetical protein